jgi:hypothetical protein
MLPSERLEQHYAQLFQEAAQGESFTSVAVVYALVPA